MSTQEIKLNMNCYYSSHDIKMSGIVNFKVVADYNELVNVVPLIQLLNNDIKIGAKLPDEEKPFTIGSFRLNSLKINSDGTSNIHFNSIVDNVKLNKLNNLVVTEKGALITLLIRGNIILEDFLEGSKEEEE